MIQADISQLRCLHAILSNYRKSCVSAQRSPSLSIFSHRRKQASTRDWGQGSQCTLGGHRSRNLNQIRRYAQAAAQSVEAIANINSIQSFDQTAQWLLSIIENSPNRPDYEEWRSEKKAFLQGRYAFTTIIDRAFVGRSFSDLHRQPEISIRLVTWSGTMGTCTRSSRVCHP